MLDVTLCHLIVVGLLKKTRVEIKIEEISREINVQKYDEYFIILRWFKRK